MQVSVESLSNLERRMRVQVPAEQIDTEVENRLKNMVGKVRLDGFRPGKVPLNVIRQKFSSGVYQEVLGEVMQSTFQEAVSQEKIKLAGMPEIDPGTPIKGKELEYTATFEVYPEIELTDMKTIELTIPKVEITEADIDKMIENLRVQQKQWEQTERAAEEGDQVVVDFEGSIDGETFEGGKAEAMPIELGEGRMIPGFEEPLVGMKAGEEKMIDVTFPEDYQAENLAAKTAQFAVKVAAVNEAVLPEIDAEFIQAFGVENGKIESLREEARSNMQRELDQAVAKEVKNRVMEVLAEKHEFDIPQAMVKDEIGRLQEQMQASMGQQGATSQTLPDNLFEEEAKRRVKLGLLVSEIVSSSEIKLDNDRVQAMLENVASSYQDPESVIQYYRNNPEHMDSIRAAVMEEQVVEWIQSQAKTDAEESSFEQMMNPTPKGDQ